jgi:hypothetical protein
LGPRTDVERLEPHPDTEFQWGRGVCPRYIAGPRNQQIKGFEINVPEPLLILSVLCPCSKRRRS